MSIARARGGGAVVPRARARAGPRARRIRTAAGTTEDEEKNVDDVVVARALTPSEGRSRREVVRATIGAGVVAVATSGVTRRGGEGGGTEAGRDGARRTRAERVMRDGRVGRVVSGVSEVCIRANGTMRLRGVDSEIGLVTTLADDARLTSTYEAEDGSEVSMAWSDGTMVRATRAASVVDDEWCRGIADGVLIEVSAPMDAPSGAAELAVRLRGARGGEKAHWYGGSHLLNQLWPLERGKIENGPFYPFDHGPNGVGNVVGTHWVSSDGALIFADPNTDLLHVGVNAPIRRPPGQAPRYFGVGIQNASRPSLPLEDGSGEDGDGTLRIQSRENFADANMLHPWQSIESVGMKNRDRLRLRVVVSAQSDAKSATRVALAQLPKPSSEPLKSLMFNPIWTTWATSHADVTQESTMALARDVLKAKSESGLPNGSIIEIDDRWQTRYGDLDFDVTKFPDPKGMVRELHKMGFLVTVWVMPFLQESSAACEEAKRLGYLIEGSQPPGELVEVLTGGAGQMTGSLVKLLVDRFDWPPGHWEGGGGSAKLEPGQFRWWGTQPVRAIDFTNDDACEWFVRRLQKLQDDIGLDGFKFDAGEPCFMPYGARTRVPIRHPQEYSQAYIEKVCSKFPLSEVRVAMSTNSYTGLVRMGDKDSVWGSDNGLQSLIPSLLTSSVLGYPFTLPDIIGGNAYWNQTPDTELMIRWAQASALMPAVQWSIPPWDISKEAYEASIKVMRVREKLLLPKLAKLAHEAKESLEPICRPMWWLDPKDPETFVIDDQFVVGEDIIVAPVIQKGATSRTVYFPSGTWRRYDDPSFVISGARHILVDAPLDALPVFVRANVYR